MYFRIALEILLAIPSIIAAIKEFVWLLADKPKEDHKQARDEFKDSLRSSAKDVN